MATKPVALGKTKPVPPPKPVEAAANDRERADLELLWSKYRFDLKTWQTAQNSEGVRIKSQQQQKDKQKQIDESYGPMQERLRKQQEAEKAKTQPTEVTPAADENKPVDSSGLEKLGQKRTPWA
jgi:hypothetical protein